MISVAPARRSLELEQIDFGALLTVRLDTRGRGRWSRSAEPDTPLGLDSAEPALSADEGVKYAALPPPDPFDQGELVVSNELLPQEIGLGDLQAIEPPVADGHLFHTGLLDPVLGLIFLFETRVKLSELLNVFTGQDGQKGATALTKGIQAGDGLTLDSSGAG
jgi:hypothetical protein